MKAKPILIHGFRFDRWLIDETLLSRIKNDISLVDMYKLVVDYWTRELRDMKMEME